MIKPISISLAIFCITFSSLAKAAPAYVVGTIESFDQSDFSKIDRNFINGDSIYMLELKVPVVGGYDDQLIFDIDAHIVGDGYYDVGYECYNVSFDRGYYWEMGSIGYCNQELLAPADEFFFEVEMSAYCSGFYIGSNIDNRDALLQESEVKEIKSEVESWLSQHRGHTVMPKEYRTKSAVELYLSQNPDALVMPPFYSTRRSMNLILGNTVNTEGSCIELTIRLEGNETIIDNIDLDILIAEPF